MGACDKFIRASSFATESAAHTIDRSGDAIMALLKQAADLSKEDCDRAISLAHQLSLQLRAAEDRAEKLQTTVERLEDDTRKAEYWLAHIHKEIEDKFFTQKELRNLSA